MTFSFVTFEQDNGMDDYRKERIERLKRDAEIQRELSRPLDLLNELNDHELLDCVMYMANKVVYRWKADFLRTVKQLEAESSDVRHPDDRDPQS